MLKYLKQKRKVIDSEINNLIPEHLKPEILTESSRHTILAGGKRLRPVLTLTSAESVGGDPEKAIKTAAGIELLHTFTLVHDDIMDQDHFRRGEKTVHEIWGKSIAIIAGDALFAKVFEALAENAKNQDISSKKLERLLEIVSKASFEICQGQAMDLEFERKDLVEEEEYLEMVEKKTGALMDAATRSGALLGGATDKEVDSLGEYGRLLGIAFQIHDDYLGTKGDENKVGKPVGSDIEEGKWTILAVHAYNEANDNDRKRLVEILNRDKTGAEEVKEVLEIYEDTKAVDFACKKSKELVKQAKKEISDFPDTEAKRFLLELADFSVEREL
ncbi:MAG: polyprenyl synthetase family protein [Candidatus Hadarchaeota archaeon]